MRSFIAYCLVITALVTCVACDPAMLFEGRIRAVPCGGESTDSGSNGDVEPAPLPGIQVVRECDHEQKSSDVLAISNPNGILEVVEIGEWGACDLVFQSPVGAYVSQRHSEQDLCRLQQGSLTCHFLSFDIDMVPVEEYVCPEQVP